MKSFKQLFESVRIDTIRYERTHGKKPKGGSGTWMFTNVRTGDGEVFSAPRGTYGQAQKAAKEWAKKNDYNVIYVME